MTGLSSCTVSKATVSLIGLSHTWPDDLDVLLVGPQGQMSMLMSDAGGSTDIVDQTVAFDAAAAAPLSTAKIETGTYQPTNLAGILEDDAFPGPAPAGPYTASLAVFEGTAPNGTWKLYVSDDVPAKDNRGR